MRTIITFLCIVWFQQLIVAQSTNSIALIYSEEDEMFMYKEPIRVTTREIVIESLPPMAEGSIAMDLSLNVKGFYSFKKDDHLVIPEHYAVVIEDQLTGAIFDLRSSAAHEFSFNRAMADRFVMQITKTKPVNGSGMGITSK
jgi:hypothetical protein